MLQSPPLLPTPSNRDQDHLRLLAIFHLVYAILVALSIFLIVGHYFILTFAIQMDAKDGGGDFPLEFINYLRAGYVFFTLIIIAVSVANFMAAQSLKKGKNRLFLFIISGINCLNMPLGTTLGVFTIIVIMRPSVIDFLAQNEEQA